MANRVREQSLGVEDDRLENETTLMKCELLERIDVYVGDEAIWQ